MDAGRHRRALVELDEAVRRDPGSVNAQLGRATVYGALGRLDRSLAALDEAVRIAPDDSEIVAARDALRRDLGKMQNGGRGE